MVDLNEWERQIDRLADRLLPRFYEEVMVRVSLAAFTAIVFRTPVWENKPSDPPGYQRAGGLAKGSWQLSIGGAGTPVAGTLDPSGNQAIGRARRSADRYRLGPDIWISNALPYIKTLEFGLFPNPPKQGTGRTVNGFSTQAPRGMVRTSMADVRRQIPAIVRGAWSDLIRGQFNGPRR